MKPGFEVRVLRFRVLEELEGVWLASDFRALLDMMEFEDSSGIDDAELRDMCLMSLQDLEPRVAAALLLRYRLGDRLSKGEIDNMSNEMLDEKLWEEDADMALHEQLFNVGSLLYAAFPGSVPVPDAVQAALSVTATNEPAEQLVAQPLGESFLVRLLADGMDEGAVLHRLFDEQIQGTSFPEADTIVWTVRCESTGEHAVNVEVISSGYWLDPLREVRSYESNAYADRRDNGYSMSEDTA